MLRQFAVFLSFFQAILFFSHFLLFETLRHSLGLSSRSVILGLALALAILSLSFLSASLLGFRYYGPFVRAFYTLSAIWLGAFNYLFIAVIAWWLCYLLAVIANLSVYLRGIAILLFGVALAISAFGVINASWPRMKRIRVQLAGLPASWRGRTLALVSDLHLGHVRGTAFAKSIVERINRERPDLVIIAGDLFDGTAIDADRAIAPLQNFTAPFGIYFSEGNHEEIRDPRPFLAAIAKQDVRILDKQRVDLDGLQLVGVPYRDATHAEHFRSVLAALNINTAKASVLICHAPDHPAVAEQAGISLQLSGHTHGGQFLPYTWIATRIYRQFVHGLSRLGTLQVYTSYGAGTWGPPLRVGSHPEIALIRLETSS